MRASLFGEDAWNFPEDLNMGVFHPTSGRKVPLNPWDLILMMEGSITFQSSIYGGLGAKGTWQWWTNSLGVEKDLNSQGDFIAPKWESPTAYNDFQVEMMLGKEG